MGQRVGRVKGKKVLAVRSVRTKQKKKKKINIMRVRGRGRGKLGSGSWDGCKNQEVEGFIL